MDPTIMKLLEGDEDESMHSRAGLEALVTSLHQVIGRTDDEISQDSDPPTTALLPQGSNSTLSPLAEQWQTLDEEINRTQQSDQDGTQQPCFQQHESSQIGEIGRQSGSQDICPVSDIHQEKRQIISEQVQHYTIQQGHVRIPAKAPSHVSEEGKFQLSGNQPKFPTKQCNNQQGRYSDQASTLTRQMEPNVYFGLLIPILLPHLDKDRAMQLDNVFAKLRSNEIDRDDFLRVIRSITGVQRLKQAAQKLMQARAPRGKPQSLPGENSKTPQKKPSIGQKKRLDSRSTLPASRKKQKISGAYQDQSIEQLNDITADSGVNLTEEEEQLLTAPKEETCALEAARRAVQEEEERLILHKSPLLKKIAEIMSKSGIENAGSDVNHCLSMCVEERLHGIISSLVRVSKKRLDIEKIRHKIIFTSDVRCQILEISQNAKEELEKKQTEEVEKLKKPNDTSDGSNRVASGKDKDKTRSKASKVQPNEEEYDKMRTTAANVAVRIAVGGDDMLSKWQLMAEQARQKLEGSLDGLSGSQKGKLSSRKALHGSGRTKDTQDGDKKGSFDFLYANRIGTGKKGGGYMTSHEKVARNITVKDLIAVLEREHRMSRSTLLYRLYDRMSNDQPT